MSSSILICPVCQYALTVHEKLVSCDNNHTFDKAKQGYFNLLLCQHKNSLNPGDNKEMVKSRFEFLKHNHYQPIAELIHQTLLRSLPTSAANLADIGCGTGYYLSYLANALDNKDNSYWGCDISKEAIQIAGRQNKDITWIVSNANKLPFQAHSLNSILSVFSPFSCSEIQRILSLDGVILVVTPGDAHLIELRNILFAEVHNKLPDRNVGELQKNFILQKSSRLSFNLSLNSKTDIFNLLNMTPFYWRSSKERQSTLFKLESLSVTIDIILWIFTNKKSLKA